MSTAEAPAIQKTPGVCGGAARIANHRITVAHLVWYRKRGLLGQGREGLQELLVAHALEAYAGNHHNPNEIERDIWFNDTAGNVPDGTDPPTWVIVAGLLLGIPEAEIRGAFDPPLTEERIAAAWDAFGTVMAFDNKE